MEIDGYTEAHRYDGAVLERGERTEPVPCAVGERDVAIVRDVWRYKFLTTSQLLELWWPGRPPQAGSRRLLKLHRAGYLDRFRPISRNGSYAWTYQLGAEGHRLLKRAGVIGAGERFVRREIYEFGHALHDIQLNAWVIAYRRTLGPALLTWDGETDIQPPTEARRGQHRLDEGWSAEGLHHRAARPLRPDAVLEIARPGGEGARTFLIEYDRTRRVDKNFDKLRRYDGFLCWWWRDTSYHDRREKPWVLFVCQDEDQQQDFVEAADREMTGHRWHPSAGAADHIYTGRRRTLFTAEREVHTGKLEAQRVPNFPPGHPARQAENALIGRVRLPGPPQTPS